MTNNTEKCKGNLKACYLNRINQKKSTQWSNELGASTHYADVTLIRAKILHERFHEVQAMGLAKKNNHITVEELLKEGYGKINLTLVQAKRHSPSKSVKIGLKINY